MLRYLRDAANMITAAGYLFCALGLYLALNGRPELGIAAVLWAWFLDHWDGEVARRTQHARPEDVARFGKSFDGFCDLIHGVLFPATVVLVISDGWILSLLTVAALVLLGSVRLSYFSVAGLTETHRFSGLPVSYEMPLLAVLFLARPVIPEESFIVVVNVALLVLAGLHVSTIQVPAIRGAAVPIATVLAICGSALLAAADRGYFS